MSLPRGLKLLPGKGQAGYCSGSFQQISGKSPAFAVFSVEKGVILVKISNFDLAGFGNIFFFIGGKHNGFVQTALVKFIHEPGFQPWIVHL